MSRVLVKNLGESALSLPGGAASLTTAAPCLLRVRSGRTGRCGDRRESDLHALVLGPKSLLDFRQQLVPGEGRRLVQVDDRRAIPAEHQVLAVSAGDPALQAAPHVMRQNTSALSRDGEVLVSFACSGLERQVDTRLTEHDLPSGWRLSAPHIGVRSIIYL
ncbi:MAG TPA: hypothetical protein VFZ62_03830 [Candidatus Saccharimonadales bacterium]